MSWLPPRLTGLILLWLWLACTLVRPADASLQKWEATNFCKCICFGSEYAIIKLDIPDTPSKPCLTCTKQWCLNQNLAICNAAKLGDADPDTATGKEGDVEARCFQRDSPRDQLVVTLYLLIVFGLLLGAGIKSRMRKAGIEASLPWNTTSERWQWQSWIPFRTSDRMETRHGYSSRREPRHDYVPLSGS